MRNEKRHSAYKGLEPTEAGALQLGFDLENVVEVMVAKSTAFDPVDIEKTKNARDEGATATGAAGGAAGGAGGASGAGDVDGADATGGVGPPKAGGSMDGDGRVGMLSAIGGRTTSDKQAAAAAASEGLAGSIKRKSVTNGGGQGVDLMAAIAGRGRGGGGGGGGGRERGGPGGAWEAVLGAGGC